MKWIATLQANVSPGAGDDLALWQPLELAHFFDLGPPEHLAGQEGGLRPKDPLQDARLHEDAVGRGITAGAKGLHGGQECLKLRLLKSLEDLLGLLNKVLLMGVARRLLDVPQDLLNQHISATTSKHEHGNI